MRPFSPIRVERVTAAGRELAWEGAVNVRDLGGQPLESGGTTRFGVVVRADNVRKLTAAGWQAFLDHGVRRVIDLRWHEELADDPPVDVPVEVVHISLFGAHRPERRLEIEEFAAAATDEADFMRRLYGHYLEAHPREFGAAIEAVASADGAVVVHCTAGKDRTGLVAALLLRVAGVGIESIVADYALSDITDIPGYGDWLKEELPPKEARIRDFVTSTPPEGMASLLRDLDEQHGSATGYLESAGVDPGALAEIKRRLAG
jgi:protein-tyrosine phosphatase